MKVLDIAGNRSTRYEFAQKIAGCGYTVVTVPTPSEALVIWREEEFALAVLDAQSELYDARRFVEELRQGARGSPVIAVIFEPKNRPPRHKIAAKDPNVVFLQDGCADHMLKVVNLALAVREGQTEEP